MSQISELQKGLIFSSKLDEWGQGRDEVSGVMPTKTDVYNVQDRQGSGRRSLSFDGVNDYVTLPTITAFGTSDFSIIWKGVPSTLGTANQCILRGVSNSFQIFLNNNTGVVSIETSAGATIVIASTPLTLNSQNTIIYSRTGTTGTITINGTSQTFSNTTDFSGTLTYLGNYDTATTYAFYGSISMLRIFNYSLSSQQIANYSRPEYPIEATHRGSGSTKNILDLNAEGATSTYWYDKTNSLTATVSGATLVIPSASNLGATWFNGTMSNLAFTGINGLTGDITISCWINALYISGGGVYPFIANSKMAIFSYQNNLGYTRDMSTTNLYIDMSNFINTFKHILLTSTSTGLTKIYIDGVLVTKGESGAPLLDTSLKIGYGPIWNSYSQAIISDVQIWNRILDADQIKLLYDIN